MKPAFRIEFDGQDVTAKWSQHLESISITDEAGIKADTCEVSFDNSLMFSAPPIGKEFRVWLGYEPTPVLIGRYKVSSWTKRGPLKRLTISGRAADFSGDIRKHRKRSFHEKTVKEIVTQVASGNGLSAIVDQTIGARFIAHIDQQTESDVNFLSRLAKRNGAMFKIGDGKVIFAAKGSKTLPGGEAKTAIPLKLAQVSDWEATADKRGEYNSASASYMDHVAGKRKTVRFGTDEPCHRDKHLYGSEIEARAAAKANYGELARGQFTVAISMPGEPALFAEALIKLDGFDPDVDGELFAKSVKHTLSGSGYVTNLILEALGETDS